LTLAITTTAVNWRTGYKEVKQRERSPGHASHAGIGILGNLQKNPIVVLNFHRGLAFLQFSSVCICIGESLAKMATAFRLIHW